MLVYSENAMDYKNIVITLLLLFPTISNSAHIPEVNETEDDYKPEVFNFAEYQKLKQQDPQQMRYQQQQISDQTERRLPKTLQKEDLSTAASQEAAVRVAAPGSWKVVHPKFVTEKNQEEKTNIVKKSLPPNSYQVVEIQDRQDQNLLFPPQIDLVGKPQKVLQQNLGGFVGNHQQSLNALNSLLGQQPDVQLEGLKLLLNGNGPKKDHTPIKEDVLDIPNPQTKPNIKVQHEESDEMIKAIQALAQNSAVSDPNSLKTLQAQLDATASAHAQAIIADAQQKALEQVKAQHEAIAQAQAKAEKEALAQIQAQNDALNRQHAEYQARKQAEFDAKRIADEEKRKQAGIGSKRIADANARRKAELEGKRIAEEAARRQAELEGKRIAEEGARRQAEIEKKRIAEEAARRHAEHEAKKQADFAARKQSEFEARKRAEQEGRKLAQNEARKQEIESLRQYEIEAKRLNQKAEIAAKRLNQNAEIEVRRQSDFATQKFLENEARRLLEEERNTHAEAKRRAQVEAKRRQSGERQKVKKEKSRNDKLVQGLESQNLYFTQSPEGLHFINVPVYKPEEGLTQGISPVYAEHQEAELTKYYVPPQVTEEEGSNKYGEQEHEYAAKYSFGYRIRDYHHGNDFGHAEKKEGVTTKGHYHVLLPDGRMQNVHYYVDPTGYHAKVSYGDSVAKNV